MPGSPEKAASFLLSWVLALSAVPETAQAAQDPQDAVSFSKTKYEEGVAAFATSEYVEAVNLFQEAYKAAFRIEDENLQAQVFNALEYNLGRAQLEAYRIDDDAQRLRKGRDLLNKFIARNPDGDDNANARTTLDEIEAEITKLEAASAPEPEPEPEGPTGDETPADENPLPPPDEKQGSDEKPGKPLVLAGAGLLGGAVVGLGVMGAGMAMASGAQDDYLGAGDGAGRSAADDKGATGNLLSVVGVAAAGTFAVAGATLLVLGMRKNKGQSAGESNLTLVPAAGWGQGGLQLRGRF